MRCSRIVRLPSWPLAGMLFVELLVNGVLANAQVRNATPANVSHGQAKSATQIERSSLSVELRTDRRSYMLGDEITVEVLLTNRSRYPLYLYSPIDWGESASLSLWIKNAVSGKEVDQEIIPDALTPPPSSKDDFIRLPPNHIYGVVLTIRWADLSVHNKGTYDLVVEYHSPVSSTMAFGLPIWSQEKGTLPSNRVTVVVTD
jgi:hypothetical protein